MSERIAESRVLEGWRTRLRPLVVWLRKELLGDIERTEDVDVLDVDILLEERCDDRWKRL
jgi:hypothetical protein